MLSEKTASRRRPCSSRRPSKSPRTTRRALVAVIRLLGATKAFGDCVKAFDKAIGIKGTEPEFFVRRGTCKHEPQGRGRGAAGLRGGDQGRPEIRGRPLLPGPRSSRGTSVFATRALEKAATFGKDSPIGKSAKDKLVELSKEEVGDLRPAEAAHPRGWAAPSPLR